MKKLLFAFMAVALPVMASAQISLSGKITDKVSGLALPGASIEIYDFAFGTKSDSEGRFTFRNLKPGSYTLWVSYLGYKSDQRTIDIPGATQLNIELARELFVADEVLVRATRATETTGTTYRNVSRAELERNNLGQDLPFLLNQTPSVVVSSDAGNGIGYTGIRIRGSDPTRVNVTINGIPYNEAESQGTFWVNMPDFVSSLDNIQIQRGVGTSTNGAGAFGGSLNLQTTTRRDSAYAELSNSVGSYSTVKNTVSAGTGLLANRFSVDARLSRIESDGYIDRASTDLKSFFLSGAYYGANDLLRLNVFSGSEKTYQAWNGVPEYLLQQNRTFNSFTYDDQTDNYWQSHYQALYSRSFSPKFSANAALHYTRGRGYYEEFREDDDLENYGIAPYDPGNGLIETSDLVRRRWLDNHFYGFTYSGDFKPSENLTFTIGGAYNEYDGDHFGEVIRGQFVPVQTTQDRYYQGNGFKTDFNTYARADFALGKFNLFTDLQLRRVTYKVTGTNKNRLSLDEDNQLNFFNPKLGLTYRLNQRSNVYFSAAIANKEPNRDDYIDAFVGMDPKPESLLDFEGGYRMRNSWWSVGFNAYAMLYHNQLVLTGKVNDVGEYIRQNVDRSSRIGLELDSRIQISRRLSWAATATLSRNRLPEFTEFVDDYDNGGQLVNTYRDTDLAFSPSFIASSEFAFKPFPRTEFALLSKYVGEQFLDNTSNAGRKLDAFFVNDLRLSYNMRMFGLREIGLSLLVNNVLSEKYESNGYTFSYLYGGAFTTENFYFTQAPANFLLALKLKL